LCYLGGPCGVNPGPSTQIRTMSYVSFHKKKRTMRALRRGRQLDGRCAPIPSRYRICPGRPQMCSRCVCHCRGMFTARVSLPRVPLPTSTSVPATARVCHCTCHCHWVCAARACVAATRRVCVSLCACVMGDFSECGSHVCVRGFVIVCVRSKLRVRKSQGPRQSCVRVPRSGKSNRMQFCKTIG